MPAGARTGLVAVRVNTEGGNPGPADVRISDVVYRENGGKNKVPNPRFARGLQSWGAYGSGKTTIVGRKGDRAMRVKAKPKQDIAIDGARFKVEPGAEFDFAATLDVPGKSAGTGYVSIIFLADEELRRDSLIFEPQALDLPVVTTDANGAYRIPLRELRRGRYDLDLTYEGDIDHWSANTAARIRVK